MIKEAIILAGGLGTRLREAVPDLPKCLAPVAGQPFLFHVINYLRNQKVEKFIFSLGFKHELIEEYLTREFASLAYDIVIEEEPLGTGGAIQLALTKTTSSNVIVTNGDTLFKVDVKALEKFHKQQGSDCTLALKHMTDFDRYGAVQLEPGGRVTTFSEKTFYKEGLINGGVYILNTDAIKKARLPLKFSFEKEFLEPKVSGGKISGLRNDGYFIDIGIPADFNQAQSDLARKPFDIKQIDKEWTLFLDRDGVINEDKVGSYIFNPDEFIFMHGAPENFKKLSEYFKYIIVATNQRGVGRGLMTESALKDIHTKMLDGIESAGGKIDAIYYATSIDNNDTLRKPNPGMILKAQDDFPDIDLEKSIMIGNNLSDMQFGRNAGVYTVFVKTTSPDLPDGNPYIDQSFKSLDEFAKAL